MPRNKNGSRPDYLKYLLAKKDRVTANGGNQIDPKTGLLVRHFKNYKKKEETRRATELKKEQWRKDK